MSAIVLFGETLTLTGPVKEEAWTNPKTKLEKNRIVLSTEEYGDVIFYSKYAEQLRDSVGKTVTVEVNAKVTERANGQKKLGGVKILEIKEATPDAPEAPAAQ